ncbi:MAG TPA: hypothetical protein PLI09_00555 [Candidatus Hydrogenedentes bacterium]|nr:hypothetical protein [Candidatus Hydrogenedentota bacterium]
MITQTRWRITGLAILAGSAAMAWYGVETLREPHSTMYWLIYWGIFLGLIIAAFYVVLLDIRYIRLQYALGQREVFRSTIGNEEFRRALIKAIEENESPSFISGEKKEAKKNQG